MNKLTPDWLRIEAAVIQLVSSATKFPSRSSDSTRETTFALKVTITTNKKIKPFGRILEFGEPSNSLQGGFVCTFRNLG